MTEPTEKENPTRRKKRLTRQQRLFALYYFEQGFERPSRALTRAGSCLKQPSLHVQASRMLQNATVQAELDRLTELARGHLNSQEDNAIATRDEIAKLLTEILRTQHSDFLTMSADGVWFHDIGKETLHQAALKKVKTRIVSERIGSGEMQVVTEKQFDEIELESKIQAAEVLNRMFGHNAAPKAPQLPDGEDGEEPCGFIVLPAPRKPKIVKE